MNKPNRTITMKIPKMLVRFCPKRTFTIGRLTIAFPDTVAKITTKLGHWIVRHRDLKMCQEMFTKARIKDLMVATQCDDIGRVCVDVWSKTLEEFKEANPGYEVLAIQDLKYDTCFITRAFFAKPELSKFHFKGDEHYDASATTI